MSKQKEDSFIKKQDLWLKNALAPSEYEINTLVNDALHARSTRTKEIEFRFAWLLAGAAAFMLIMLCPPLTNPSPPKKHITLSNASGIVELIISDAPLLEPKQRLISMVGEESVLIMKVTNGHERYIVSGGTQ